jgi:peroxiredoxin-like protein
MPQRSDSSERTLHYQFSGATQMSAISQLERSSLMSEEHAYRVAAWWTSGRTGLAKSDSAPNAIHFTAPTEFGGLEGRWTPEELLLASIAGCYTTTLRAIAGNAQFDFTDLQVEANGTVRKTDSGYTFSEIVVRPNLKISSIEEREQALDLLKRAEKLCLVSRAIGTPLKFEPQLEVVKAGSPV